MFVHNHMFGETGDFLKRSKNHRLTIKTKSKSPSETISTSVVTIRVDMTVVVTERSTHWTGSERRSKETFRMQRLQ